MQLRTEDFSEGRSGQCIRGNERAAEASGECIWVFMNDELCKCENTVFLLGGSLPTGTIVVLASHRADTAHY